MWEMCIWEGERRGARPGIGKGPGGGSHADKRGDKLISSVYPGAGASSPPPPSSPFLPWLRSRVWDMEEEHGKRGPVPHGRQRLLSSSLLSWAL